ncbi:MAG: hypothetical protein LBH86_02200, partial [Oscillospiraceae bacterium]|nr:hypothetical protein [Oscillospiraceae bacterium]
AEKTGPPQNVVSGPQKSAMQKSLLFRTTLQCLPASGFRSGARRKCQSAVFAYILIRATSKVNGKKETVWMENSKKRRVFRLVPANMGCIRNPQPNSCFLLPLCGNKVLRRPAKAGRPAGHVSDRRASRGFYAVMAGACACDVARGQPRREETACAGGRADGNGRMAIAAPVHYFT